MISQRDTSESLNEQASSTYERYEGDREYARPLDETPYAQPLRGRPGEKAYLSVRDNTNLFRLLVFVIAMATLLVFVLVCLVFVVSQSFHQFTLFSTSG